MLTRAVTGNQEWRRMAVRSIGARGKATVTEAAAPAAPAPKPKPFSEMPGGFRWPLIGSAHNFFSFSTGDGGMRWVDYLRDVRARYGDISRDKLGPAELVYLFDLDEYMKLVHSESQDPSGALNGQWPLEQYNKRHGIRNNPFMMRGEEWKRGRRAADPHIFSPTAAKSYINDINASSRTAVAQIEDFQSDLTKFAQYSSVDMFCAVALGIQLNATGGSKEGRDFADVQIRAIQSSTATLRRPEASFDVFKPFSSAWNTFETNWTAARAASKKLLQRALDTPGAHGFIQAFMGSEKIDIDAATEMCMIFLVAAGDTTSAMILNNLYALGTNPKAQQQLREELQRELKGGDFVAGIRLPYMEACFFEANRLYPVLLMNGLKAEIKNEIELCGYSVPAGTTVFYCGNAKASEHIKRGDEFLPERWLADNEELGPSSRKEGPGHQLDHPLGRQPFGVGPRQCIGSRVAKLEARSLISRIIQDYELTIDPADAAKTTMVSFTTQSPWPYPPVKLTKL